jgi:hypothetical protein
MPAVHDSATHGRGRVAGATAIPDPLGYPQTNHLIPRLVDGADRVAAALGYSGPRLAVAELVKAARRATGLSDFGDVSFEEPLAILLKSYDEEANLTLFGRFGARWDAVRFLSNLLLLRDAEKRHPTILDQVIDRPIFITGLPRSGSTFLHSLLAEDPTNHIARAWETIHPCPPPAGRTDRRARQVDRQLAMFGRLAPEFQSLHPFTAQSPQECTEITAHVFRSLRFDTTHAVPGYRQWMDDEGHLAAYRFHRRFLQHLQYWNGPGCWVLKSPDHIFALDALHAVYPDARFIFTHRHPLDVLPSVARLTDVLRRPFTRSVDRLEIGEQVGERWAKGAALLVEQAARVPPDRAIHLKFRDLVRDPFDSVSAVYEHFGLPFSGDAAAAVRRLITERPDGGYGRRQTRLEAYGLDRQATRPGYRDYIEHFGI